MKQSSLVLFVVFTIFLTAIPAFSFAQTTGAAQGLSGTTAFNWSGYISDIGVYTGVTGNWVIPTVANADINTNSADATWVGIGGVLSHDLIQAGTEAVPTARGGVDYQAWYELLPDASQVVPLVVHTGDAMSVSIEQESNANGLWKISFSDTTTGQTYNTTVNYASSLSSAEWIEEMPAGVGTSISLDNFGTVNFSSGSTVQNGSSMTIAESGAQPLTMANMLDQPLAVPSDIGTDGASFSVTRTNAVSNAIGIGDPFGNRTFITSIPMPGDSSTDTSNADVPYDGGYGRRHGHYSYTISDDSGTISVVIQNDSFGF